MDPDARFSLSALAATGNGRNSIGVEGGTLTHVQDWQKSGINTYDLHQGDLVVAATGTLNIHPGVTVRFEYGRSLTVNGALTAVGTAANPILITGDVAAPGQWGNLAFYGTAEKSAVGWFEYATLEYGGYGGAAMLEISQAEMLLHYCTLRYSSSDAIRILAGPMRAAVRSTGELVAPPVQVNWSSFTNIGGDAIHNGSDQAVEAAFNWWGAVSGPLADDNPGGNGSKITGPVHYRPYLLGPDGAFVFLPFVKSGH
jgi:hypothetical protein